MKQLTRLAALIVGAALFMTGCPLLESDSSGSLTFRVTGEMAAKIAGEASSRSARSLSAEDVSTGSTTEGLYLDIALKGGYSASKTIAVAKGAAATFSDIPVGTTLYAEGEAYRTEDGEKVILYTGKSEKITIQEGVNTLSLKMQKVKQEEPAAETYTVTFETNGGSEIEAQTVTSGETASEPTAPTLEGYGFAGWYSDSDLTSEFSFDTAITADITLYAKWYFGAKKPTEAKDVGDIVFSDGSATAYTSELTLTDEQKAVAVAVIFYVGSGSGTLGEKTLGVGLKNARGDGNTLTWARYTSDTDKAEGYSTNITAIQCTPSESGSGKAATATFTGDLDGSDNWQALCEAVSDEGTSGNYPAWEWVNAYATTANLTGDYANGWYLPTVAELCMLYRAKDTVNPALEKAGGTQIASDGYWSSSLDSSNDNYAWYVYLGTNGNIFSTDKKRALSVCGVRDF